MKRISRKEEAAAKTEEKGIIEIGRDRQAEFNSLPMVISCHQSKLELARKALEDAGIDSAWYMRVFPCWIQWTAPINRAELLPSIISTLSAALADQGVGDKPGFYVMPGIPQPDERIAEVDGRLVKEIPVDDGYNLGYRTLRVAARLGDSEDLIVEVIQYHRQFTDDGDVSEPIADPAKQLTQVTRDEKESFDKWVVRYCDSITSQVYGEEKPEKYRIWRSGGFFQGIMGFLKEILVQQRAYAISQSQRSMGSNIADRLAARMAAGGKK